MNQQDRSWFYKPLVNIPRDIFDLCAGNRVLSESLVSRGFFDTGTAKAFLKPNCYTPASPFDFPQMSEAVTRIIMTMRNHEKILVWGDFDVDGMTSTTIMTTGLKRLGFDVAFYIPIRSQESHGLNIKNLERLLENGIGLVITCDTGSSANDAASYLQARNVDMIITDHHILPEKTPYATALINPHFLDSDHPSSSLCGAGVALSVISALSSHLNRPEIAQDYFDFAALGLVADVAVLKGDARYLVQKGLEQLRKSARPSICALFKNSEIDSANLTEEHLAFGIVPRLNAVGRLSDANPFVDFLISEDLQQIEVMANQIEGLNARRKMLCDQVFLAAREQIEKDDFLLKYHVLVIAHPDWPAGVIGIAASRLVDIYNRPVILISAPPDQVARGSARSIEGVDINCLIATCGHLLEGFGGHSMAAGLSIRPDQIPFFRREISSSLKSLYPEMMAPPPLTIDQVIRLEEATPELAHTLELLAPFGPGNPPVIFASKNLALKEMKLVGKYQEHRMVVVEDEDGTSKNLIWWQGSDREIPEGRFDLAYSIRAVNYRGNQGIQLEWVDYCQKEDNIRFSSPLSSIDVIDHRNDDFFSINTGHLQNTEKTAIWAEGPNTETIHGTNRYLLKPADNLIIVTIPPGRKELEKAIRCVAPKTIMLFSLSSGLDQPADFIKYLTGLVKHVILKKEGAISILELAAATGHNELSIQRGLAWMVSCGQICIVESQGNSLKITAGGVKDLDKARELEKEIVQILHETAAFRLHYLRAEPYLIANQNVGPYVPGKGRSRFLTRL